MGHPVADDASIRYENGGTVTELPRSVWQGSFFLYGVAIKCHTLDDGQRIIEAGLS